MTNVTEALREAGVKLPPLNKRVWLWLHDHPGKTYAEVAAALNESHSNVSSTLGVMHKRNTVKGVREIKRGTNIYVARYSTIGKAFELKPAPKTPPIEAPVEVPAAVEPPKLQPDALAKSLLDTLSVKEAFALYQELRSMFNKE